MDLWPRVVEGASFSQATWVPSLAMTQPGSVSRSLGSSHLAIFRFTGSYKNGTKTFIKFLPWCLAHGESE